VIGARRIQTSVSEPVTVAHCFSTGVALGLHTNTTSAIPLTNGGTGESSTASVTVIDQIFKNGFD
jgi:hypothetical protein